MCPACQRSMSRGRSGSVKLIDGYVSLGQDRPGLGQRLLETLPYQPTIVGVAKNHFKGNNAISGPARNEHDSAVCDMLGFQSNVCGRSLTKPDVGLVRLQPERV